MEEPYVPYYKPYGMSDEEFEEDVRIAQKKHDEWEFVTNYCKRRQYYEELYEQVRITQQKHDEHETEP